MSSTGMTRIIDGDGHIIEDNAAIIAHMDSPYREIAARKGIIFPPLDHLHAARAVETTCLSEQIFTIASFSFQDWIAPSACCRRAC